MTNEHLDPYAILQALGVHDATNVVPVQGGTDTAIWRAERAGQIFALRVFQCEQFDDCCLEQEVMQVMERDMASKCTPEELARIRRWTMRWKGRVGCA
jgi:hypothetical protein